MVIKTDQVRIRKLIEKDNFNKIELARLVRLALAVSLTSISLLGCATSTVNDISREKAGLAGEIPGSKTLIIGAMESVRKGDLASASRAVNVALRFEPENPNLHFLNGFVYHLSAARGDPTQRDFAETGYRLALDFDPNHLHASYFLGQLYLDAKRWRDAQEMFAQSIKSDKAQARSYLGLTAASYSARDLATASWASAKGVALSPDDPKMLRAALMVSSASGDTKDITKQLMDRYSAAEPDRREIAKTATRLQDWQDVYKDMPTLVAQATATAQERKLVVPPLVPRTNVVTPANDAMPGTDGKAVKIISNWLDCPGRAPDNQIGNSLSSSSGSIDETAALPALPSPCEGKAMPKMAIIDATIIRSEDTTTSSHGVNLLDNLAISLSGTLMSSTGEGAVRTINRSISLGANPGGSISYSLNIANASDQRAEVIARPSLVALDRLPSQFFSGSNITIALPGNLGGGSAIDKPVGVSLSVTPTFITDDSMLLAVKATRSFFEVGTNNATFQQAVQTSRNAVLANVIIKFGQTLILSGLSDRESTRTTNGVPVLKDIPILQYGFKRETEREYNKSVIFLLTPRKPMSLNELEIMSGAEQTPQKVTELLKRDGSSITPNLQVILKQLERNIYFQEFRTNDITTQNWRNDTFIVRIFKDLLDSLYF